MSEKLIHDFTCTQGIDVFDLARIILSYEQEETLVANENIINAIVAMAEIRAKLWSVQL